MVKVGFICEGRTDKLVLESKQFNQLLERIGLKKVNVVFTGGVGNLLPQYIELFRKTLRDAGAEKIFIVTDLDTDKCITLTKKRLQALEEDQVVIAVRAIESWFLADSQTISFLLNKSIKIDFPEQEANSFETLRIIFMAESASGRGVGTKPILARRMIKYGFSLEAAAAHPHCPSARYFLTKLTELTAKSNDC